MKDKLVFVKTKSENNERCPDCHIGVQGNCIKNKSGLLSMDCEPFHHYKLSEEEQVKIQTEYEWKKERLELIDPFNANKAMLDEADNLRTWLKENKPTNFQPCTRENTKVGDEVRIIGNKGVIRKIEHIFEKQGQTRSQEVNEYYDCVANNSAGTYPTTLAEHEIDLNNTEE